MVEDPIEVWRETGDSCPYRSAPLAREMRIRPSCHELLREAAQSIQQREFGTAAELLRKVLTSDPESSPAYNLLGICQAQTGQYEGARKFFEKAIELDPNFATARVNLGNLLLGM